MMNSMKIFLGVALIFLGLAMMVWTYRAAKKVDNKFSVVYFMIISGYGAGIGWIALGANILCTLWRIIGGSPQVDVERQIRFYNRTGALNSDSYKFSSFERAIDKIHKWKPTTK